MTEEVIQAWHINDLECLMDALLDAEQTVDLMGNHASAVHPNMRHLVLIEETLADGSKVMNLHFSADPSSLS